MGYAVGSTWDADRYLAVRVLHSLNRCFARVYHHVDVRTPCRLPRRGAAILACNHLSGLDPILIQSTTNRIIRWMMAKEYYEQKSLRWMLDLVGTIPVDRGGRDMAATRAGLAALKAGHVLGVFPEGRIETSRALLPFQPGIALLAIKSGAPIYPAYLEGTQRGQEMLKAYFFPNRAILTFGEPRTIQRPQKNSSGLEQATAMIQNYIEILRVKTIKH
jgi:1-acyl-sn-glycerol-3-phosphate acyltransferase